MTTDDPTKKRQHPRVKISDLKKLGTDDVVIKFQVFGLNTGFITGKLLSISQGGLFIRTLKQYPQGTQLFLQFTFAQNKVQCIGEVLYQHPPGAGFPDPGVGVRFNKIVERDFKKIREVVANFYSDYQFDGLVRKIT